MMIRLFSATLLLGLVCTVHASTLYRWVEADGSITFSPVKPAAGIDYEVVGGLESSASENKADSSKPSTPAPSRTDQQSVEASVQWMNPPTQRRRGSLDTEPPFAAARPLPAQGSRSMQSQPSAQTSARTLASSNKRSRQCEELNMRVTSLEERMRARLTPDAMDRTVMSMARYQKSLNQFCR